MESERWLKLKQHQPQAMELRTDSASRQPLTAQ